MAYQYTSTRSFESVKAPGVAVKLRKVNEKRRAELMRDIAPLVERQRAFAKKFASFSDRSKPVFKKDDEGNDVPVMNLETCEQEKEFSPEDMLALTDLLQERDNFEALEVNPIYIRWGVASIEGLEIDGRPATVDDLLGDDCPDGLVKEILDVLSDKIDLSSKKNPDSSSLSTDADPELPTTSLSSATTAATTGTTA